MGIGIAAGVLGAAGSIFGGIMGASGAAKQAAAVTEAARIASQTTRDLNALARNDLQPFRTYGTKAGNTLQGLLLGTRDVSAATQASPLFQFQSELGMRNINRELAARGLFNSGAGLETLQRFNNQLVAEEGNRLYERLFGMTDLGLRAAGGMASGSVQTGTNLSNLQLQAGQSVGQAYANQYNALGQGIGGAFNQIGNGLLYGPMINSLSAGSGVGATYANSRPFGSGLEQFRGGSGQFIVNAPGTSLIGR